MVCHACFVWGSQAPRWTGEHIAGLLALDRKEMEDYFCCEEMKRCREIDADLYVTLSLRGCARGPPLVPADNQEEFDAAEEGCRVDLPGSEWPLWLRPPREKCTFPKYLERLLQRAGLDIPVYVSLDGREVVQYQAVVPRRSWQDAASKVGDLWLHHR